MNTISVLFRGSPVGFECKNNAWGNVSRQVIKDMGEHVYFLLGTYMPRVVKKPTEEAAKEEYDAGEGTRRMVVGRLLPKIRTKGVDEEEEEEEEEEMEVGKEKGNFQQDRQERSMKHQTSKRLCPYREYTPTGSSDMPRKSRGRGRGERRTVNLNPSVEEKLLSLHRWCLHPQPGKLYFFGLSVSLDAEKEMDLGRLSALPKQKVRKDGGLPRTGSRRG